MPQAPTQPSCLPGPGSGNAGSAPARPRHDADTAAVRRTLDVSSCHLSAETWAWLDVQTTDTAVRNPTSRSAEILGGRTRHGWFIYAGLVPTEPVPADLLAVMRHAQHLKCDYILFDADARPLAGLPILHPDAPGASTGRAPCNLSYHLEMVIWEDAPEGFRMSAADVARRMETATPEQMARARVRLARVPS